MRLQKITQSDVDAAVRAFKDDGGIIQRMADLPLPPPPALAVPQSGYSGEVSVIENDQEEVAGRNYAIPTTAGKVYADRLSEANAFADVWGTNRSAIVSLRSPFGRRMPGEIRDQADTATALTYLVKNGRSKKNEIDQALGVVRGAHSMNWMYRMGWVGREGSYPVDWFITVDGKEELRRRARGLPAMDIPLICRKIYNEMVGRKRITTREMKNELGLGYGMTYNYLRLLIKNGYAIKTARSYYVLTDKQQGSTPWKDENDLKSNEVQP